MNFWRTLRFILNSDKQVIEIKKKRRFPDHQKQKKILLVILRNITEMKDSVPFVKEHHISLPKKLVLILTTDPSNELQDPFNNRKGNDYSNHSFPIPNKQ